MKHPLHAICPYFAMFPETFVAEHLLAYTRPGELVFDPFCGRGTTVLESLLNNRAAIGSDINPVAACISSAKSDVPELSCLVRRIDELELSFCADKWKLKEEGDFFRWCFHDTTYQEICHLKAELDWHNDRVDCFLAAVMLGILHGESHKSEMCLSNRMPRTISTKPDYSVRWWKERGLRPPRRETFRVLRQAAAFRFTKSPPECRGTVVQCDSRQASSAFAGEHGRVALVVTSPPYIDTTDYSEDQWLRLWFLGGRERPVTRLNIDDRHTRTDLYWEFLKDVFSGTNDLMRDDSTIVVRIGGTKLAKEELLSGLESSVVAAMPSRRIRVVHGGRSSEMLKRQTNSFRPGTSNNLEHDFTFSLS